MVPIAVVASIIKPLLQYPVMECRLNHANGSTASLTPQSQCDASRFNGHLKLLHGIPNSRLQRGRRFVLHHVFRFAFPVQHHQQRHHQFVSFGGFRVLFYEISQPLYIEPTLERVVIGINN